MKAAVWRGVRDVRVENVPDAKVEPGGVLVKVNHCGICGTDLHHYNLGTCQGIIFGHEFSGEVVGVGTGVEGINIGDHVTDIGFRSCGKCNWCKQGAPQRCSNLLIFGENVTGAMAEYISLHDAKLNQNVFKLPANMSYEESATIEPLAVSSFAIRRAKVQPENTVAVIGAGIIGLGIILILKANGVSKIIASARRASRLNAARESGADLVIDAAAEDTVQIIKDATDGQGVDVVFDCAGNQATFQQGLEVVRRGGKFNMVALYEQPFDIDTGKIISKNIALLGIMGGHFPSAIEYMASGKVNTRSLITHHFPLDQVKEAFETQIREQDAIKVLIDM